MTEREHREGDDAALLRELQRHQRTTSARHDEVVLEAARAAAALRRTGHPRARPVRLRLGISLAAVLVAAAGLLWLVPLPDGPPGGAPLLRGEAAAVSPSNGASLDRPPTAFEWPEQPGAATYRVVLLDAGARPIWRSEPSPENRLVLPEEVSRQLAGGGTYLWLIEAGRDGRSREIGPFFFDVTVDR